MSRESRLFLEDIAESCRKIVDYARGVERSALHDDYMRYDAILWNLLVIGEAAKHLPADVRTEIPEIDWRAVAGLRDVLVHAYFRIDDETLWDVIREHVPDLREAVRRHVGRG